MRDEILDRIELASEELTHAAANLARREPSLHSAEAALEEAASYIREALEAVRRLRSEQQQAETQAPVLRVAG